MKKIFPIVFTIAIAICVSSCYKIFGVSAPKEVKSGETFIVTMTVVDDGDAYQKFIKDWSVAGIRVPDGWTVAAPTGNHRSFAEDWVYYEDGTKADRKFPMIVNEKLSAFYNEACPKDGYKWVGFQTRATCPKFISACWRNGCDSIQVSFKVEVPDDCKPGTYEIDLIGGDIENADGVDAYNSVDEMKEKDSRSFHVGTFNNSKINHVATQFSQKITVVENESSGVNRVETDKKAVSVYNINGQRLNKPRKGINIIGGKTIIY